MNNSDPIIVHCMACDEPIYELVRPIFWNSVCSHEDFKSLEPDKYADPQHFEMMNCPKCGKFFPDTFPNSLRIKTNKGMMPNEPK